MFGACGQVRKKPEKRYKKFGTEVGNRGTHLATHLEDGKNSIRLTDKNASRMLLSLFPHPHPQVGGGRLGSTLAFEKTKGNFFLLVSPSVVFVPLEGRRIGGKGKISGSITLWSAVAGEKGGRKESLCFVLCLFRCRKSKAVFFQSGGGHANIVVLFSVSISTFFWGGNGVLFPFSQKKVRSEREKKWARWSKNCTPREKSWESEVR